MYIPICSYDSLMMVDIIEGDITRILLIDILKRNFEKVSSVRQWYTL